ncbi:unnamed protein product [Lactuca saligna]|uniref:Uncharacterized protein n=1 Tax=Lactuca saligna TaxID=75948 RepID=A0AA35Z4R6_LACSI|nr:unnamed protein product [Lactuca saligna]
MKDDEMNNKDSCEYRGGQSTNFRKDAKDHREGYFRKEHGKNSIRNSSFISVAIEFETSIADFVVVGVITDPRPNDVSSVASDSIIVAAKSINGIVSVGFYGGFCRVFGIIDLEDNLSHPPSFSNFNGNDGFSEKSYNNYSFFSEIQNTLEMGKAMGYNLDGCFDRVKEIVEGNGDKVVLKSIVFLLTSKERVVKTSGGGLELFVIIIKLTF